MEYRWISPPDLAAHKARPHRAPRPTTTWSFPGTTTPGRRIASSIPRSRNAEGKPQLELNSATLVPGPHLDAVREALNKGAPGHRVKLEGLVLRREQTMLEGR